MKLKNWNMTSLKFKFDNLEILKLSHHQISIWITIEKQLSVHILYIINIFCFIQIIYCFTEFKSNELNMRWIGETPWECSPVPMNIFMEVFEIARFRDHWERTIRCGPSRSKPWTPRFGLDFKPDTGFKLPNDRPMSRAVFDDLNEGLHLWCAINVVETKLSTNSRSSSRTTKICIETKTFQNK